MKFKNGKKKVDKKIQYITQTKIYMIFNNMKQEDLLVIVSIIVKLVQRKLIQIKPVRQILVAELDQKQEIVKIKKILTKLNMLFMEVEN